MTPVLRRSPVVLVGLAALLLAGSARASTYPLEHVIPKESAEKLAPLGIKTSEDLLAKGTSAKERTKLAATAKVTEKQLSEWVKMCDLLRIRGVGPVMVRLLGAGGVSTVKQLRAAKLKPLYDKMMKANEKTKVTQNPPSEKHLEDWIDQAKKLKVVLR